MMNDVTFSVVARDPATGDLGGAVASRFLAVGSAVLHARADVGIVATQALANLSYGPRGLALLEAGATARQALDVLVASDGNAMHRQAGMVDAAGRAASYTGTECLHWAGHVEGEAFACQGNILVSTETVDAMVAVMTDPASAAIPFPERLVAALAAGQDAGGDSRGQQSAALLVVRRGGGYGGESDRMIDLRVDDHGMPISELQRLLSLHRLYFEAPRDEDLMPIDEALAREITAAVARIDGVSGDPVEPPNPNDPDQLWQRLERWAGRENLEERMVRRGHIDRTVLEMLRQQAGAVTGDV